MRHLTVLASIIIILLTSSFTAFAIEFKQYPIQTQDRSKLMAEYNNIHYGYNSDKLIKPELIVIHYTAIPDLNDTVKTFNPDSINSKRAYILKNGKANVGVQFVVAKNGDIYSLLPENITGRHAIGYNHLSFGIENFAKDSGKLTPDQLKANVELVAYLVKKYPTIKYMCGHHEYVDKNLPHYKLYKEQDKNYKPTHKIDPGDKFMSELREQLKNKYNIVLQK